jgi:predicted DNA-binding protein (UPF0251 family)
VLVVEQWAEVRRLHFVDEVSVREHSRRTGLHRKTIRPALASAVRRSMSGPVSFC